MSGRTQVGEGSYTMRKYLDELVKVSKTIALMEGLHSVLGVNDKEIDALYSKACRIRRAIYSLEM